MTDSIQKDIYFMNNIAFRLSVTKKKDGLWNCKCPINGCDDNNNKKRFFFVARQTHILAYCHDCGYSTNLKTFIKEKYPDLLNEYKFYGFSKKEKPKSAAGRLKDLTQSITSTTQKHKSHTAGKEKSYISNEELHRLTIPIDQLAKNHPAAAYVQRRQIPTHLVRYTKNFYTLTQALEQTNYKETYKKYKIPGLVIPFYNNQTRTTKIIQTRFFDPKVLPKYLTIKLDEKEPKIYNQYNIDTTKTIYILEGPIDAMFCGNAIAMAGSDIQVNYKDQVSDYVWVWDNEPDNDNINKKMLKKIQEGQKIVIWKPTDTFKDINDGIISGEIKGTKHVQHILQQRTVSGLRARLAFAKFRR